VGGGAAEAVAGRQLLPLVRRETPSRSPLALGEGGGWGVRWNVTDSDVKVTY